MCRDWRRCPGCNTPAARAAHNQRRRDNRIIKKQILAFAQNVSSVPPDLEKMPMDQMKIWARGAGAGTSVVAVDHGSGGTAGAAGQPGPPATPPGNGAGRNRGGGRHVASAFNAGRGGAVRARGGGPAHRGPTRQKTAPARKKAPAAAKKPKPANKYGDPAVQDIVPQVDAAMALDRTHWQEQRLLSPDIVTSTVVGPGTNETLRVEFRDGTVGYFKSFAKLNHPLAQAFGHSTPQQPLHEVAAWQLAKNLGPEYSSLVAPCVLTSINGKLGSIDYGVSGKDLHTAGVTGVPAGQMRAVAFFDALVGNQDRHPQNVLVDNRGVSLIDHGYAFSRAGDYVNHNMFARARAQSAEAALSDGEKAALAGFLASPDSHGLKGLLEDDRLLAMKARATAMLSTGKIIVL